MSPALSSLGRASTMHGLASLLVYLNWTACAFALLRGDREVRILAAALVAGMTVGHIFPVWRGYSGVNLARVPYTTGLVDVPIFLIAVGICLTTRRRWPFVVASSALLQIATDTAEVLSPVSKPAHIITSWTWMALYTAGLLAGVLLKPRPAGEIAGALPRSGEA